MEAWDCILYSQFAKADKDNKLAKLINFFQHKYTPLPGHTDVDSYKSL